MIEQYIIMSPSRVGSTFLHRALRSATKVPVITTHNPFKEIQNKENTCLIMLTRRDLFRSIMSALIHKRVNTNPDILPPFTIDCDTEFVYQYNWHKFHFNYVENIDSYYQVKYLYAEDFINNPNYIFTEFNLPVSNFTPSTKSDLIASKVITNYNECLTKFNELEQTVKFVKNTTLKDLVSNIE